MTIIGVKKNPHGCENENECDCDFARCIHAQLDEVTKEKKSMTYTKNIMGQNVTFNLESFPEGIKRPIIKEKK